MNKKILDILEFDKVKQLFEPYLQTEQGEMELAALTPTDKKESIETAFMELEDMEQILLEEPRFAVSTIQDVRPVAKRLEMEAALNIDELLALKAVLRVTHELKDFYDNLENVRLERLNRLFDNLVDLPRLQGGLQAINEGGFVESFASEKLAKIRRRIQENEHQVREILQDLLKSKADMLADAVIASRNGRNVLPVKNTYRNRIAGVVHDISASGNTVYIEPRAVVNLNEEIANHRADERYEIIQILEELSDTLRPHAAEIANNAWIIGHLDLIKAKYRFMRDCKAVVPEVSNNRSIQLLQLRHPLIENAVANDLHFTEDLTEIVITGPNTGGKTIMLKTLGLAQIMAQSGLPILADPGSRVGIFSQVFADIGDEQSIEQSLSTFSSHMTTIVNILENFTIDSLILVDELGSGTDPIEGANLAISLLERFYEYGAFTLATTHYHEIKNYCLSNKGFENASAEFDIENMRPTYHILMGIPGKSNAFAISQRLGIPKEIIERASSLISKPDTDIETLMKDIYDSKIKIEEEKKEIEKNLNQIQVLRKSLENDVTDKLKHEKEKIEEARNEAKQILIDAKEEANEIISKLSKMQQSDIKKAEHLRNKLNDSVNNSKAKGLDLSVLLSLNNKAPETLAQSSKTNSKVNIKNNKAQTIKSEINVIGETVAVATEIIDQYLDSCYMAGLKKCRIIHGKGTGKLRQGIHEFLKKSRYVDNYYTAGFTDGDIGATIVKLKSKH